MLKKNNNKIIIIVLLIVLLGAIGTLFVMSQSDEASELFDLKAIINRKSDNKKNNKDDELNTTKLQEYFNLVDEALQDNNFDEAIAVLETAEQLLGEYDKITDKKSEVEKKKFLFKIDEFEQSSNYADGITYINKELEKYKKDSLVLTKLNLFKTKYKDQSLEAAKEIFESEGYAKAIERLYEALKILPSEEILIKKIEEYHQYEPVALYNLKLYGSFDRLSIANDSHGNMHTDAFDIYSLEYELANNYSKLNFKVSPKEDFPKSSSSGAYLKIYADEKLVYTSKKITYKTDEFTVSVNVKNVKYISIEKETSSSAYYQDVLIYDAYLSK